VCHEEEEEEEEEEMEEAEEAGEDVVHRSRKLGSYTLRKRSSSPAPPATPAEPTKGQKRTAAAREAAGAARADSTSRSLRTYEATSPFLAAGHSLGREPITPSRPFYRHSLMASVKVQEAVEAGHPNLCAALKPGSGGPWGKRPSWLQNVEYLLKTVAADALDAGVLECLKASVSAAAAAAGPSRRSSARSGTEAPAVDNDIFDRPFMWQAPAADAAGPSCSPFSPLGPHTPVGAAAAAAAAGAGEAGGSATGPTSNPSSSNPSQKPEPPSPWPCLFICPNKVAGLKHFSLGGKGQKYLYVKLGHERGLKEGVHRIVLALILGPAPKAPPPSPLVDPGSKRAKKGSSCWVCCHTCNNADCLQPFHMVWGDHDDNNSNDQKRYDERAKDMRERESQRPCEQSC
jgi:hypothetical protein